MPVKLTRTTIFDSVSVVCLFMTRGFRCNFKFACTKLPATISLGPAKGVEGRLWALLTRMARLWMLTMQQAPKVRDMLMLVTATVVWCGAVRGGAPWLNAVCGSGMSVTE